MQARTEKKPYLSWARSRDDVSMQLISLPTLTSHACPCNIKYVENGSNNDDDGDSGS